MSECKTIEDVYEACCESCHDFIDCPYAPILKLLAEAKEMDHLRLSRAVSDTDWEMVTFWIRR